jgi:hypothetical protein
MIQQMGRPDKGRRPGRMVAPIREVADQVILKIVRRFMPVMKRGTAR